MVGPGAAAVAGLQPGRRRRDLRSRAAVADAESPEEADEIGRRTVLDLDDDEAAERLDVTPGADPGEPDGDGDDGLTVAGCSTWPERPRPSTANSDEKLKKAVKLVDGLLQEGYHPILFCRFIPRPNTWPRELREPAAQGRGGRRRHRHPRPRRARSSACSNWPASPKRVLVCTDCLSEGINLQEHFDAVVHYDLSWNPTRHEQREGRVDRYGQPSRRSSGC